MVFPSLKFLSWPKGFSYTLEIIWHTSMIDTFYESLIRILCLVLKEKGKVLKSGSCPLHSFLCPFLLKKDSLCIFSSIYLFIICFLIKNFLKVVLILQLLSLLSLPLTRVLFIKYRECSSRSSFSTWQKYVIIVRKKTITFLRRRVAVVITTGQLHLTIPSFKACSWLDRDLLWWEPLTMVLAENKV